MKLKEAWELVCSENCCLFINGDFFAGFDTIEVEKEINEAGLWNIEVEGFSTFNGYLKVIASHQE